MWCSHKPSRSLWGTSCSWQKLLLTKRNSFSPYQSGAADSAASPTASRYNVCSIESVLIEFTWTTVRTGLRRDEGRWTLHTKHLPAQTQPRLMESDILICRTLYDCETELYNHPYLILLLLFAFPKMLVFKKMHYGTVSWVFTCRYYMPVNNCLI